MAKLYMGPLEYVLWQFGGASRLAEVLGISKQAVSKWKHRDGDYIPAHHQAAILQAAKANQLDISESDIIHGRDVLESEYYGDD